MNKENLLTFPQKKILSKQTVEDASLPLSFVDEETGAQEGEEQPRVLGQVSDRGCAKSRAYSASPVLFFIHDFGKACGCFYPLYFILTWPPRTFQ